MRYKVGDKVRVRGDLEVDKEYGGVIYKSYMEKGKFTVKELWCYDYVLDNNIIYSSEMLRPAEFKIWCETEEEKQAVLEELKKEGYVWYGNEEKPTNKKDDEFCFYSQMALYVTNSHIKWDDDRSDFESKYCIELTPSEFTGIDFFKKIIITKTPTGATATYGDKTVTTEGEFEDASRQALAEVLCPFKVGDKIKRKSSGKIGIVKMITEDFEIIIKTGGYSSYAMYDELEPYAEPEYNAKLFCIKGHGVFKQGKIYEIKDGKFTPEANFSLGMDLFESIENINERLQAQFMEVKEN